MSRKEIVKVAKGAGLEVVVPAHAGIQGVDKMLDSRLPHAETSKSDDVRDLWEQRRGNVHREDLD